MSKKLLFSAASFIFASSLLFVGSALAYDPSISITPDTTVVLSGSDSVRIWIFASDPDPDDTITVEKTYGIGTYDPNTDLAPISDEFYFHPDTIGLYTFIFPVTDEHGATSSDSTAILVGPLVVDFRQSANEDSPYEPGDVHWIGSILQQNNSTYYEGMSTLQRIVFINIPKTTGHVHTLNFSHQANKGANNHAYDFLTSWDQAVQAGDTIGGPTMFVNLNECGPEIGPPADLGAICAALHASGDTATPDAPDAMGTLIGDDVASKVAFYEAQAYLGNRTVKIYGNTTISAASIAFNGYTGSTDKYADYTLTWTSSSDSIVIEMAGHLAAGTDPAGQPDVGYGAGRGSAYIHGGPYHFKLYTLDGAVLGNRDNQIKGADIRLPPPVCSCPEPETVCVGGDVSFTVSATGGTSPYSYAWWKTSDPTDTLSTDATLPISDVTLADAGDYRVVVTDANALACSCLVTLTVNENPICSITPQSAQMCEGESQQFCAQPTGGTPPYTYLWSPGGEVTQCITVSPPAGLYTYWVKVTDANNCTTSCEATLEVESPSCTIDPPSDTICEGDQVTFCVQPTGGTPPYTYLWSPGGEVTQCITVSPPAGSYTYWVKVTDANNCTTSCEATLTVEPCECCPSVWIDTVDCVNPGDYVELPIYLDCTPAFGTFELEIEFDYTALCFVGAKRGSVIPEGWEEFTYRLLPCPIPPCQKYKILVFGMYDMPDGVVGQFIEKDDDPDPNELVLLQFVVINDQNLRGMMIPVCWEWEGTIDPETGCLVEDWDCGENTFSSVTGDTLYTSILCCQFVDSLCDDLNPGIEPILRFQPDTICVSDCYTICGGILVCPADSAHCKRGDVNANGVPYEVADAVLFARFFVEGEDVFIHDKDYQICATDVNADGRTLTLSDFAYLIRVILHDAVEIPKLVPSSEVVNVMVSNPQDPNSDNTITTECASPIGAILFEFDGAVVPTLLATNMEMRHHDNKVLVWSREGNTLKAASEVISSAGEAELMSVSAVDYDTRELPTNIVNKVAPTSFALHAAYPNPFNPFVNLSFTLPEAANYSLRIYNVAGQLVRSYEGLGSVGLNVVTWDGKANTGDEVASSIYFYKLTAGGFSANRKMVVLK